MTGAGYGLVVGPLVIALALGVWLLLTVYAARHRPGARAREERGWRPPG